MDMPSNFMEGISCLLKVLLMKYQVISHQHIFTPGVYFRNCHASTVALLPKGGCVCAWFGGDYEKAANVAIWFSRQENGVWDTPRKIADAPGIPCWNPVLFVIGEKLVLYYKVGKEISTWQTYTKESSDWGDTWSQERELVAGDIGGRGPVKNKCIRLKSGKILAPASTELGVWESFVDISCDDGASWERSETVPMDPEDQIPGKGVIQPALWEDDLGIVNMYMRSSFGRICKSKSFDEGRTWTKLGKTSLPNNNSGIDLVKMEDGRLVMVYNPVSGNWANRCQIGFAVSEDNGQHWSEIQTLDYYPTDKLDASGEFSYPAIVSQGEDVYITYTWKRETVAFWHIRLPKE